MATYGRRGSGGGGSCDPNEPEPTSLRVVRLASTSNIAALTGSATIDSTATVDLDRVVLTAQSTASQNGIWVVNHGGAWTRPTDWTGTGVIEGGVTRIAVTSGDKWRYSTWNLVTLGAIDIGTTSIVLKPESVDFDPVQALTVGTRARIGLQDLFLVNAGVSTSTPMGYIGSFVDVLRVEGQYRGMWLGGAGYRALASTAGWMSIHGGQGKPTGIPEDIAVAAIPGAVAVCFDVTNKKWYGYDTEVTGAVTAAWHAYGAAYSLPKRGTNLTDADQTLQPVTDTASEYCQFTALTGNRSKTLGVTSTFAGQTVDIVRADGAAQTLAVVNGGGGAGTLFTFASGQGAPTAPVRARFRSDGTNWTLDNVFYIEA